MTRVFFDTCVIYASLSRRDALHNRALLAIETARRLGWQPVMTAAVAVEVHLMLDSRLDGQPFLPDLLAQWWEMVRSRSFCDVIPVDADLLVLGAEKLAKYNKSIEWDIIDATSFAAIDRNGIEKVISFDKHFAIAGYSLPAELAET